MAKITAVLSNHIHSPSFKPSTHGVYERYLQNHIEPFFGNTLCSELNNALIQNFADKLMNEKVSANTAKGIISFLKKGLSGHYPPGIFEVRFKDKPSNGINVLSVGEQKALENAAKNSDMVNRLGVFLCLYTGIRIGELCGLMWQDVDFARREFYVRRTVQRIKNMDISTAAGAKTAAKTTVAFMELSEYSNRRIPLPNFLIELLGEGHRFSSSDYVISKDGGFVEPRNLQYRFKKLLKLADIEPVNFQALRHTFAVRALESHFDVLSLSRILGHASPFVTYSRYATLINEENMLRKSMENLAGAMQRYL